MNSGGILNEESAGAFPLQPGSGRRRQKIVHLDQSATERVPPHSHDAEMAVLGAMMLEKEAASKVLQILNADAFYRETHKIIFEAMTSLSERNQPIDIITVNDELRRQGKLAEVGGSHYLAELNMRTPTSAHVEHHARIVFERALKRRLISAAMEIIGSCFQDSTDAFEELDHAEQTIFQISESRGSRSYHTMKRLAFETIELLEAMSQRRSEGSDLIGVPSGLSKLDQLLGGFQKSDLVILAARPSMGKTGLALTMARNAAINFKKAIAFFSLEMAAQQLVTRLISGEAKIDAHRLRTGDLSQEDWQKISSTIHRLAEAPVYIDDTPALGIMELRARARLMRREHNIEMIVIDYLQLMHAPKAESREREISMISRGLKQLAKELEIPIIALSQLNRSVESRGDKRPMLSDLRESGCLTGDSLVPMADSGQRIPMRDLVGRSGFAVWALNLESHRLERATVSRAFATGTKRIFRLTTRLGRTIRATANHRFLTIDGWKHLDELRLGEHLALPRQIPSQSLPSLSQDELTIIGHLIGSGAVACDGGLVFSADDAAIAEMIATVARGVFGDAIICRTVRTGAAYIVEIATSNPEQGNWLIASWLQELGIDCGQPISRVPDCVFQQPSEEMAHFLLHLWTAGGTVRLEHDRGIVGMRSPSVRYAASSRSLALDIQSVMMRLGISARVKRVVVDSRHRDQYHVIVSGRGELLRFAGLVGAAGQSRTEALATIITNLSASDTAGVSDSTVSSPWSYEIIDRSKPGARLENRLPIADGIVIQPETLSEQRHGRGTVVRITDVYRSEPRTEAKENDIYWDPIMAIEQEGVEEVFDLTVPGHHNFVADDIVVHNSIEQDADVVMFVHRPEYYGITVDEDGLPTEGTAEVIIGKQRNGPTGVAKMAFISQYARFENLAFQYDDAAPHLPPDIEDEAPF